MPTYYCPNVRINDGGNLLQPAADGTYTVNAGSSAERALIGAGAVPYSPADSSLTAAHAASLVAGAAYAPPALSGPHIGFFGSSVEMRNNCIFSTTGNYVRASGVVTLQVAASSGLMRRFQGHEIHVSCLLHPEVEGVFNLNANSTDNGSITQLTYNDARPDTTFLTGGQAVNIVDRQAASFSSGIPAFLAAALGGRVRFSSIGISGAEVYDVYSPTGLATRLMLFATQSGTMGPYDVVVLAGGLVGNSIVSAQTNAGAADLYNQLVYLCNQIKLLTGCKVLYVCTNWTPGTAPTSGAYTRGTIIYRRLYDALVRACPFVRIAQSGEAMNTSWQPSPTAAPGANTLYGYPPSEWLDGNGPHLAQRGSVRVGQSVAVPLAPMVNAWLPFDLAYGDCRPVNGVSDKDGALNPSIVSNWFGQITSTALSGTGVSGNGPPNVTVSWGARSNAVVVGSLGTEPEIGNVFRLTVTDNGPPSGLGATLQIAWAPPELLTWLNSTDSNNALIDLYMPLEVKGFADFSLMGCQCALIATIADGNARVLAAPLLDQGDKSMANLTRHMGDEGMSALAFRAPRVRLPNNITFTSAYFLWTVQHCGTTPWQPLSLTPNNPGTYTVTLFPTTRLEKIAG